MQPASPRVARSDSPRAVGGADGPEPHVALTRQLVATLALLGGVAWQVVEAPGVATALRFLHRTGHETGQTWLPTVGSFATLFAFSVLAAALTRRRVPLLVGLTATAAAAAVLEVTQPVADSYVPAIAVAAGTALALCLPRLTPRWQAIRWAMILLCWPVIGLLELGPRPGRGQVLGALVLVGLAGFLPALAGTRRRSALANG